MSFGWIAAIGTGLGLNEARKSRKQSKKLAAQADATAQKEVAAIEQQSKVMAAGRVTPPPPPPPAPVSNPIRQARPGTGSSIFSPGLLMSRAKKRKTASRQSSGGSMGYGSRL